MQTARGDAISVAQPDPRFRTRSPERAIDVCATAFYPHRLSVLGPSHSFGLTLRLTQMGPITLGDITYDTDVALSFNEVRANYHVNIPLKGWVKARHRGQQLTSTPVLATNYRTDAEVTVTHWPAGSRHLAVSIDQFAVDRALETLVDGPLDSAIAFGAALPINAGAAQDWVRLVLMVQRQLDYPDSLIRNPLVWEPLVESVIHGLLLVADHPYRDALDARAEPARPAAVRDAMDIIETCPQTPLTTTTLAMQCHISVRTLQEGFRRHLGMSPMAYLRTVRLRHAHRDLRSANPSHVTVASIAHRWGFSHLGRFAAAHKAMFSETPLQVLQSGH